MNDFGLSDKKMTKQIKKVSGMVGLEQMLSVEVKGQPPNLHTFHKVRGRVIEPDEQNNYDPDEIEKVTVELPEKKTRIAVTAEEFKDLLNDFLLSKGVKFDGSIESNLGIENFIEILANAEKKYKRAVKVDARDVHLLAAYKKMKEYLESELVGVKQALTFLNWHGSQTELVELVKALIENGTLSGKQKDIMATISDMFQIEIKRPDKTIQELKNRNIGSETIFLDKLKTSLLNYFKK